MRTIVAAAAFLLLAGSAQAKVSVVVDKDAQTMTVSVDGEQKYRWLVSSGNPSHETPNGDFRPFRMEKDHFSKEFDDAPMPNSVFFTKQGHAIHGTFSEKSLGIPASHGCVRLSRANAATFFALVQQQGLPNVSVTLTGSSKVALARNPGGRNRAVAQRGLFDTDVVDGINVGQPGRYGRLAMSDEDNRQTRNARRGEDQMPSIFLPGFFSPEPAPPTKNKRRGY